MEKVTGLKLPPIGYWLLAVAGSEPVARHENSDGYAVCKSVQAQHEGGAPASKDRIQHCSFSLTHVPVKRIRRVSDVRSRRGKDSRSFVARLLILSFNIGRSLMVLRAPSTPAQERPGFIGFLACRVGRL